MLHRQGDLGQAEEAYRRGIAIRESTQGPEHPELGAARSNLAKLLRETDRGQEAAALAGRGHGHRSGGGRRSGEGKG